jgi:tRNA U34 2-thiouridine synthase MnmA/TrmU
MIKWYVAKKDVKKNIITAAPEGHKILLRKKITIKDLHLIDINKKDIPKQVHVRIRQVGELIPATIKRNKVILEKAITGVSEGQAIVLYEKTKCLGGGVIGF